VNINQISKALYAAARLSRDINAVSRGPRATGNRIVRKAAGRGVNGALARLLNKILKP
jgi:hypothetical protein